MEVELQPDDLEALQAETGPEPVAKVSVDGPVRVQGLPRKAGATFTKTSVGSTPVPLLRADHRRASALVVSVGQNMYFALNAASAQDVSRMCLWPQNVPLPVTADTDIWVAAATGTTSIGVVTEYWATGD